MAGSLRLLRERRFLPLFITQFLGAFNDNVLKNAMVILITFQGARLSSINAGLMVSACGGIFILPFFLFSATAGQLADKYEKSRLIRLIKLCEILIMGIAAAGFCLPNLPLLLIALFLMGAHSTFFGPLKYSILPQHLHAEELVGGNALVEGATFLAILLGTILGGLLIALGTHGPTWVAATCTLIALLGWLSSRSIPVAASAAPTLQINWNIFSETARALRLARDDREVFVAIIAISWFWFYGAMFLSQFPAFAKDNLGGDEYFVTLLLALFSIGVSTGSLLCARLSHGRIEPKCILAGAAGLTLFAVDLFFAAPHGARMYADLILIGVCGGLYCVPLYTLMQSCSDATQRSRIIGANNIMNALFMVTAAVLAIVLLGTGSNARQLFLITALLNAVVTAWLLWRTKRC
ncbi:MAG TPA: MFS transporter [Rhodocyclaceae bacterium]|jgi:MFS family permease|nr:MFS transporter [Rhodocyclaceae bacterium]